MDINYHYYINIFLTAIFILLVFTLLAQYRISMLKQQLTDLRIRMLINLREQAERHQLLMEQIKRQSDKPNALDELQHIFGDKITVLRRRYPSLTDTDLQVLVLIGLGVDNHEILNFTNMSKRTYYKRRQIIAQRMGTTAAHLDELAKTLFTPKI